VVKKIVDGAPAQLSESIEVSAQSLIRLACQVCAQACSIEVLGFRVLFEVDARRVGFLRMDVCAQALHEFA
jgi:hypothetical protein